MSEEYLWDRSGEPDADVESLERLMGELAFTPRAEGPLLRSSADVGETAARSKSGWRRVLAVTLLSAAATLLLISGWKLFFEPEPPRILVQKVVDSPSPSEDEEPEVSRTPRASDVAKILGIPEVAGPASSVPAGSDGDEPDDATANDSSGTRSGLTEQVQRQLDEARREKDADVPPEPADAKSPRRKPSTSEIKAAMGPVKRDAKACVGAAVGGITEGRVRLKLSVEGRTGRVTSVKVSGDGVSRAQAACLEHAARKARFAPFEATSMGFVYVITL